MPTEHTIFKIQKSVISLPAFIDDTQLLINTQHGLFVIDDRKFKMILPYSAGSIYPHMTGGLQNSEKLLDIMPVAYSKQEIVGGYRQGEDENPIIKFMFFSEDGHLQHEKIIEKRGGRLFSTEKALFDVCRNTVFIYTLFGEQKHAIPIDTSGIMCLQCCQYEDSVLLVVEENDEYCIIQLFSDGMKRKVCSLGDLGNPHSRATNNLFHFGRYVLYCSPYNNAFILKHTSGGHNEMSLVKTIDLKNSDRELHVTSAGYSIYQDYLLYTGVRCSVTRPDDNFLYKIPLAEDKPPIVQSYPFPISFHSNLPPIISENGVCYSIWYDEGNKQILIWEKAGVFRGKQISNISYWTYRNNRIYLFRSNPRGSRISYIQCE